MLSLFISFEVLQIHDHSNDINFLLNYSFKVGNKADLQRGRRYLAAKDGDWLDRDYPKDEIPVQHHHHFTSIDNALIQKGSGMFSPRQLPHQRAFPNCLLPLESPSPDRQVIQ